MLATRRLFSSVAFRARLLPVPKVVPRSTSAILKPTQHIAQASIIRSFGNTASSVRTEPLDHDGNFERQPPKDPAYAMTLMVVDREGVKHSVKCKVGDNLLFLLRVVQEKKPALYLEGACEASLACSTCHVIFDDDAVFAKLPEAKEEEEDMLDQAACLSPTSRLGCQIFLEKHMDGTTIILPKFSRNMYVDGHVPKPH